MARQDCEFRGGGGTYLTQRAGSGAREAATRSIKAWRSRKIAHEAIHVMHVDPLRVRPASLHSAYRTELRISVNIVAAPGGYGW